jgi:hypothetical protein
MLRIESVVREHGAILTIDPFKPWRLEHLEHAVETEPMGMQRMAGESFVVWIAEPKGETAVDVENDRRLAPSVIC